MLLYLIPPPHLMHLGRVLPGRRTPGVRRTLPQGLLNVMLPPPFFPLPRIKAVSKILVQDCWDLFLTVVMVRRIVNSSPYGSSSPPGDWELQEINNQLKRPWADWQDGMCNPHSQKQEELLSYWPQHLAVRGAKAWPEIMSPSGNWNPRLPALWLLCHHGSPLWAPPSDQ